MRRAGARGCALAAPPRPMHVCRAASRALAPTRAVRTRRSPPLAPARAYTATRTVVEVTVESLPQLILQASIFSIGDERSRVPMYCVAAVVPGSMIVSVLSLLGAWVDLNVEAKRRNVDLGAGEAGVGDGGSGAGGCDRGGAGGEGYTLAEMRSAGRTAWGSDLRDLTCSSVGKGDEREGYLPLIVPETAKEKDKNGYLPLHYAVWYSTSEAVVKAVLAAHPEASKEKDKYGYLPLHYAAQSNTSEAVVQALLAAHPEASKEKDKYGYLPLHLATQFNTSEVVVKASPPTRRRARRRTKMVLPLHLAVWYSTSEAVVKAVLPPPEASKRRTNMGTCRSTMPFGTARRRRW